MVEGSRDRKGSWARPRKKEGPRRESERKRDRGGYRRGMSMPGHLSLPSLFLYVVLQLCVHPWLPLMAAAANLAKLRNFLLRSNLSLLK